MLDGPVLKHVPDDFVVRENMVVTLTDAAIAEHRYLLLRKSGYTTMEAVRLLADRLGVPSREVTYGGLKDEDGITEQLVALPVAAVPAAGPAGDRLRVEESPDRWLYLLHYGYGREPLRIGRLEGNGFRIVLRNLTAPLAQRLAGLRKVNHFFLNYYDTQRFGVPGGPKQTHLVGAAILAGDWDAARDRLVGLRAPESPLAARWTGGSRDFFLQLDPRTTAFYLAAASSHRWNAELAKQLAATSPGGWVERVVDGLAYRYPTSTAAATALLGWARELPYRKYTFEEGEPVATGSIRATVVQTTVSLEPATPDSLFPGRYALPLGFFLPSGCYATTAVRQLLCQRQGEGSAPEGDLRHVP